MDVPDAAGFERFYRENWDRIVRGAALVTLDVTTAEDVASEAFARLWSHWAQIHDDDHAGGYVFKSAMRLAAREVSRRRRASAASVTPSPIARIEEPDAVWDALAAIPLRQRQVVVLRDWAGFPTREVAAMLRMRESTARVHLARGRERLRALLRVGEEAPRE